MKMIFLTPLLVTLVCPTATATNEWLKTSSGNWEEPFWSLGVLPAFGQGTIAFRSAGFKSLAIGSSTTSAHASSLSIDTLIVDAPAGSSNQLHLNFAGFAVPLSVSSDFVLGPNATLLHTASALTGGNFYLNGTANIGDFANTSFTKIAVGNTAAGVLNFTNGLITADQLLMASGAPATVNQFGGTNQLNTVEMYANSIFNLNSGLATINSLELQSLDGSGIGQLNISGGQITIGTIRLGRPPDVVPNASGEILLTAGLFRSTNLIFATGKFTQTGGTNITQNIRLPLVDFVNDADYFLSGGTLISSNLTLGGPASLFGRAGVGRFNQSGGIHTNLAMFLVGELRHALNSSHGFYNLSNGLLLSSNINLIGGSFSQTGGTNYVTHLFFNEAGAYTLSGGELSTSNTTVDTCCVVPSVFTQSNGVHRIQNQLLLQDFIFYRMQGGTLIAPTINLSPDALLELNGGSVSNATVFLLNGGTVRVHNVPQNLAPLQLGSNYTSTVDCSFDPSIVHFRDSHAVAWNPAATLLISNWNGSLTGGGAHQVFIGTNAQGVTSTQLSQISFKNIISFQEISPARILSTGEIVPLPKISIANYSGKLVLTWPTLTFPSTLQLLTATNVTGPYTVVTGASSPYTNSFTDPRRFFQLRSP